MYTSRGGYLCMSGVSSCRDRDEQEAMPFDLLDTTDCTLQSVLQEMTFHSAIATMSTSTTGRLVFEYTLQDLPDKRYR